MPPPEHPRVAAVERLLRAAGATGEVRTLPDSARTAATQLGVHVGGVAPLGHPEPIGTLVDIELARHEQVWAAAGHPHTVFPTTYDELLRLTGGTPAEVGPGPVAATPSPVEETLAR